jgi:maltokinase
VIAVDRLPALLEEHLPAHISRQRWSGAHEHEVSSVEVVWADVVEPGEPLLVWALADARLAGGVRHRYQVFIGGRAAEPAPAFLAGKERQLLAVVPGESGDVVLYDALIDPDLAIAVLHLTAPDAEVVVRRPIVLEHSNSSVVFDESILLKVFRKIEPGPNPDVEITRVLTEQGCPLVIPPLASLERDGTHLAVLRPFMVGATEGWEMARTSVRDVLASRLPPEESGGDLGPNSVRLGATIAGLHLAMADAWGSHPTDLDALIDEMVTFLEELGRGDAAGLDPAAFDLEAVRARLDAGRAMAEPGPTLRIHGDLHLAQVIRVDTGWLVIDFEGEPGRRRPDRTTDSSPLRDVAGMLRSFHYAAASGLAEWDGDDELASLATAWEERNRDAFLEGYFGEAGIDRILPADPAARAALLAVFELDKAVYELAYELGHRPEKVSIPLAGIDRLLRRPVST